MNDGASIPLENKKFKEVLFKHISLTNTELIEDLIKSALLSTEDLKYLLSKLDTQAELKIFNKNSFLLRYCITSGVFKDIVDKYKNTNLLLPKLLKNTSLFKELTKNNILNKEDLRYLFDKISDFTESCEKDHDF